MKPVGYEISDASFIRHYYRLLLVRLKKFKNLKHVVLIGVVLICVLTRDIVLLGDKNPIQNKLESVTEKIQKSNNQILKLQLVPNSLILHNNILFKFRPVRLSLEKSNPNYFMVKMYNETHHYLF